jgi:2-polyprenyl-6-methoxyphenol hydroxylase-like FAD-dependent oxidoreductase
MCRKGLKVRIIGAGTGGLCLAQGLRQDGVDVEVYERDHAASDRVQGYRLSIRGAGRHALKECLPQPLYQRLVETCARPSDSVAFLDHRLNRLLVIDLPHADREDVDSELPVSRIALRHILSEGLGDVIRYGKTFVGFDEAPGAVRANFADGSSTTGDVLIGADGAGSRVRAQLLPAARRVRTGILAVSGKVALNGPVRRATPQPVLRGPALILGPRGCFMFSSTVDYDDAAGAGGPYFDREQYVMWGFSTRQEAFGFTHTPRRG